MKHFDVNALVEYLTINTGTEEMRAKRGVNRKVSGLFQIRLKSKDLQTERTVLFDKMLEHVSSEQSKILGITDIQTHVISPNSGSLSSISFTLDNKKYDIVIARGKNKGEKFEKHLLLEIKKYLRGEKSELGESAILSLEQCNRIFAFDNILDIEERTGSTKRNINTDIELTGKIIGDYTMSLRSGGAQFISVKDTNGRYFANFGAGGLCDKSLVINTDCLAWKELLVHFGLSANKFSAGLQAKANDLDLPFNETEILSVPCGADTHVYRIMKAALGINYFYLRKMGTGFRVYHMSEKFLEENLLKNLKITQLRYPFRHRKYCGIALESDTSKFLIDIRNAGNKHDLRPSAIRFSIF